MAEKNPLVGTRFENSMTYQSNYVIDARRKNLSIIELRLFYLALIQLKPQLNENSGDKEFAEIILPTADVMPIFGDKQYYALLKRECKKLIERSIEVKTDETRDDKFKLVNIFDSIEFDAKDIGGLKILFSKSIKPYLLELYDKSYTCIAAKDVFVLQSPYSVRMLELMLEYRNIPNFRQAGVIVRSFTVEELRTHLSIPENKYKAVSGFTRRVVDAVVKEIDRSTVYTMCFEKQMNGKKTAGYIFKMGLPKDLPESTTFEEVQENVAQAKRIKKGVEHANLENEEADIISKLQYYGVGPKIAKRLAENYDEQRIIANIDYARKQKRIKNTGAYIAKAVKDDYAATRPLKGTTGALSLFDTMPEETLVQREEKDYAKQLNEFFESYGADPRFKIGSGIIENIKNRSPRNITIESFLTSAGFSIEDVFESVRKMEIPEAVDEKVARLVQLASMAASKEAVTDQPMNNTEKWRQKLPRGAFSSIKSLAETELSEERRSFYFEHLEKTHHLDKNTIMAIIADIRADMAADEQEAEADGETFVIKAAEPEPEITAPPQPAPTEYVMESPAATNGNTILQQLKELAELKQMGALTDEEFTAAKKAILGL